MEKRRCIPPGRFTDQRIRLNHQRENEEKLKIKKAQEEGQVITIRTSSSSSGSGNSSRKSSNSSAPQDEIEKETMEELSHKVKFKLKNGVYYDSRDPNAEAGPSRRTFTDRVNSYVIVDGRMMTLPQAATYLDGMERDRVQNQSDDDDQAPEEPQIKTKQVSKKDLKKKKDGKKD